MDDAEPRCLVRGLPFWQWENKLEPKPGVSMRRPVRDQACLELGHTRTERTTTGDDGCRRAATQNRAVLDPWDQLGRLLLASTGRA